MTENFPMIDNSNPPITIIIPAYNEEGSIAIQIRGIRGTLDRQNINFEIIVVDDGSTDHTALQAQAERVRVIRHLENRGYGASLKTGIHSAENDVIVIIDADRTYPAHEIPDLVNKLKDSDMVVGARIGEKVHIPIIRQPAKWFLRILAEQIAEQPIPDLNSGMRAFRRECAKQYFPILSNRFSFTTTLTLAYLADEYRIVYHPINYYPRVGKSKIVPRHFMDFFILIVRMSMMFNPLKVFVPLALTFGCFGVLKTFYDIWAVYVRNPGEGWTILLQPVLSTSALLLLFAGLQFMMIGMVADGVIRRIAQQNRPLVGSHGVINQGSNYPVIDSDLEPTISMKTD